MATLSSDYIKRLGTVIEEDRETLKAFRESNSRYITEYVGTRYGKKDGVIDKIPINLIAQMVTTYVSIVVARNPSAWVRATKRVHAPTAYSLEQAINYKIEQMDLEEVLRLAVTQAMFSVGIVKIGITSTTPINSEDEGVDDPGEIFVENILMDDWISDMKSKDFRRMTYCGDRYRIPRGDLLALDGVNEKAVKNLPSMEQPDDGGEDRVEELEGDKLGSVETMEEMVEPWDIWIPREKKIVTLGQTGSSSPSRRSSWEKIRELDWEGPPEGPYRILGFYPVPGNSMPKPVVTDIIDLHLAANDLFNKSMRRAENLKEILLVMGEGEDAADKILHANDMDVVPVQNVNSIKKELFNGITNQEIVMFLRVLEEFDKQSGNLSLLAGLSPQSDTLGQDRMLAQNASRRALDINERVVKYVGKIINDIAWWIWTDPLLEVPIVKKVKGAQDIQVETKLTSESLRGDFPDYMFSIQPSSMSDDSPPAQLAKYSTIWNQFIMPYVQLLMAQGIGIDFQKHFANLARMANLPELQDVLIFNQQMGGEGMERQRQSPVTERRNIRENRPGATRQGNSEIMTRLLSGAGTQESERAALGRPTG